MDLSRCHNGGLGSGLVMPRHPATPPSEMMSKSGKKETKNGSPSGPINPKAAFFSISNLVNGLRQQQEKGKTLMNYNNLLDTIYIFESLLLGIVTLQALSEMV